jgi:hypothetical protein
MALGLRGTKGVAAPPYTAGPYTWDQHVTFTAGIGAAITAGKIFYVDPRGPEYGFGSDQNDGLSWDTPMATIQAAVNKTVDKRGDIIFVGAPANAKNTTYFTGTTEYPDYRKIKENVLITKSNVRIFAVPARGWPEQIRPSDGQGAYLDGSLAGSRTKIAISLYGAVVSAGVAFVINAQGVEIAGFTIDTGGGMTGIYIGDGSGITGTASESYNSSSAWIHDNHFRGDTGNAGAGIVLQGCGDHVMIENNTFYQMGKYGIYVGAGSGKTCQSPIIRNNVFTDSQTNAIKTYGHPTVRDLIILNNVFSDGDNTATQIAMGAAEGADLHALIAGNHFNCTTPMSIQTTTTTSGNYKQVTTGTATYVTEA